jgi:copper ion binding protein
MLGFMDALPTSAVPTVTLPVEGMTCASCVSRVERALRKVPGVLDATVNLANETATVRGDALSATALAAAVVAAGYAVSTATVDLAVEGMTCASCSGRDERALERVPGVLDATVNLATETARVTVLGAGPELETRLLQAVTDAGYTATPRRELAGSAGTADRGDARDALPADTDPVALRLAHEWRRVVWAIASGSLSSPASTPLASP